MKTILEETTSETKVAENFEPFMKEVKNVNKLLVLYRALQIVGMGCNICTMLLKPKVDEVKIEEKTAERLSALTEELKRA